MEREEVLNGAIQGMLSVLQDPYTTYMDPVRPSNSSRKWTPSSRESVLRYP